MGEGYYGLRTAMDERIPDYILKVLILDNPWIERRAIAGWYKRHLPPRYIPRATSLEADRRVCLVVGPRQAGKSTLIWKTLSDSGKPCLYLNCEETAVRDWLVSSATFLADIKKLTEATIPVFFDEIQHLKDAGLFLKGLVDRHTPHLFYATGSSAFDLEAKTRESLAGRAIRHLLLPLSLQEASADLTIPPALRHVKLSSLAEQLLIYGGYPTVFTSKQPPAELTGLVEAFVIRDASDRLKIRYPAAFRKVLELMATQIGNLCNYAEWAAISGISGDTVREYAGILENTHVVRLIRPYVGGKRAEITSTPKAYFLDNGIRNQIFGGFLEYRSRGDRGSLMENFVFTELSKMINPILDTIRFWRSKSGAEVDFVVEHQGRITAWEVKAGTSRGRLTRSSRSFIEAYQPEKFFVVSEEDYPDQSLGRTLIRFVHFSRTGTEALNMWD